MRLVSMLKATHTEGGQAHSFLQLVAIRVPFLCWSLSSMESSIGSHGYKTLGGSANYRGLTSANLTS